MTVGLLRSMTIALSGLAGFVDAVGFLSLGGFYVAFMSGNSTLLGIGTAAGSEGRMELAGGLVAAFTFGVMVGTLLGRPMKTLRPVGVLLIVATLLAVASWLNMRGHVWSGGLMMAVAMGAENTVFNKEGVSGIGLTYMTGTLVRLGQRIAEALSGGPWRAVVPDTLLWSAMVVGAMLGAFATRWMGLDALWLAVVVTLTMAAAVGLALRREKTIVA